MERPDVDPHEVLGLEPGATHAEIRAAYLRLAIRTGPAWEKRISTFGRTGFVTGVRMRRTT